MFLRRWKTLPHARGESLLKKEKISSGKSLEAKIEFCLKISLAHRLHDWHHEIFKGSLLFRWKLESWKIFCNFYLPKWKRAEKRNHSSMDLKGGKSQILINYASRDVHCWVPGSQTQTKGFNSDIASSESFKVATETPQTFNQLPLPSTKSTLSIHKTFSGFTLRLSQQNLFS